MSFAQFLEFLQDGNNFLGFIVVLAIFFGGIVQIIKALRGDKSEDE